MNYYQPRQVVEPDRPDTGKWRYTSMNDGAVWAVGYCREDCPGHDTPEEAYQHQTAYLLDRRLKLDGQWDTQHRCAYEGCGEWTDRFAEVWHRPFDLCDQHRTREIVAELFGTVGDVISSY